LAKRETKEEKLFETKKKLQSWIEADIQARKKLDWKWFIYDLWVNGYHYVRWNKSTQSIVPVIESKGRPQIVVNKIRMTLRSVRNFVLRNKPKPEVTPDDLNDENLEEAMAVNRYLDFLADKLRVSSMLKGLVGMD
jgi:hypothetical protein